MFLDCLDPMVFKHKYGEVLGTTWKGLGHGQWNHTRFEQPSDLQVCKTVYCWWFILFHGGNLFPGSSFKESPKQQSLRMAEPAVFKQVSKSGDFNSRLVEEPKHKQE